MKKVLSAEALVALAKKKEETVDTESTTTTETAAETVTETTETVASTKTVQPKAEDLLAAHAAEVEGLKTSHSTELTALKDVHSKELGGLKAQLIASEAAVASFKVIVVGQVEDMRVALSLAKVDMSTWDVKTVLAEHSSVSEAFMKSLPVGGVVPDVKEAGAKTVRTNVVASAFNSLGF